MDGIDFSDPNIVKIVDAIGADSICENFGALVDCNSFLAPLLVTGMTNLLSASRQVGRFSGRNALNLSQRLRGTRLPRSRKE